MQRIPKKLLCFCPFSKQYKGWKRSIYAEKDMEIVHELINADHCCERSFNAELMIVHASLFGTNDLFHHALCIYLMLLFNSRNKNYRVTGGLRKFDRKIDTCAKEIHYNEDTGFNRRVNKQKRK